MWGAAQKMSRARSETLQYTQTHKVVNHDTSTRLSSERALSLRMTSLATVVTDHGTCIRTLTKGRGRGASRGQRLECVQLDFVLTALSRQLLCLDALRLAPL